jgi:hypothetical protein
MTLDKIPDTELSLDEVDAYFAAISGPVPPPMPQVCPECPYRRHDSVNRHVPPAPDAHRELVGGGQAMACHMSQRQRWVQSGQAGLRRCRGLEVFRANVGMDVDTEVGPDLETVFGTEAEARACWDTQHIIQNVAKVLAEHGLVQNAVDLLENVAGGQVVETFQRRSRRYRRTEST